MDTKIDQSRFTDNGDGTVIDRENGLMWMKEDSWTQLGRLITWHESREFAEEKNKAKFARYDDWRIPTAKDARSLFEEDKINTDKDGCEIHIDPVFTPGGGYTTWTSETRAAKQAMGYDYRADYEFWLAKENDGFPSSVRLVRTLAAETAQPANRKPGHEQETARFIDNGDGTISDMQTGLMWKKTDSYLDLDKWVNWDEAETYIRVTRENKFARYTDWQMPTRKEAMTIFDPGNPATDVYGDTVYLPKVFPAGAGATTWTRTVNKHDPALAMRFFYYNGDYKWHKRGLRSHGVRPVRLFKKPEAGQ
ncbi:MAG: DUF1566 domain-containing protein [Nitrospinales bacterium]